MTIQVACSECGQKYQLKDELAGKKVRCKKCEAVIAVPKPVEEFEEEILEDDFDWDDDLSEREKRRRQAVKNQPKAKKSKSKKSRKKQGGFFRLNIDHELNFFENFANNSGKLILIINALYVITILLKATDVHSASIQGTCSSIFKCVTAVYGILILIIAFWFFSIALEEGALELVCVIFVPLYPLYFLVSRWDQAKYPFFLHLKMCFLITPVLAITASILGIKMG